MTRPSFADYGTYDESAHPELWDGVVGYWAPCLGPTGARLHDVSRYNNWGTLTNMAPASKWIMQDGQYALDFDGTGDSVKLGSLSVSGSTTVAGWLRPRTVSRRHILFGRFGVYAVFVETTNVPSIYGGAALLAATGFTVTANEWVHLVGTTNRTSGVSTIYVNATSRNSGLVGTSAIAGQFSIGDQFEDRESADGQIDDVAVWNRALTPNEIIRLYNLGRGGMLERRRRRRVYSVQAAAVKSYLFVNRGQVIGGGTL
jgi:hypothetical protein